MGRVIARGSPSIYQKSPLSEIQFPKLPQSFFTSLPSDQQTFLYPFCHASSKMGILDSLYPSKSIFLRKPKQYHLFNPTTSSKFHICAAKRSDHTAKRAILTHSQQSSRAVTILIGAAGITLVSLVGPSHAAESPIFNEPSNALSLPTWAVHVSSVVEWATAMALVWQYGEKSGYESWKGLSWGMVPLLGGAFCACTWHFFYNSESLEVLVALQAALTVIGNATMCIAAYRICISSQERSENL